MKEQRSAQHVRRTRAVSLAVALAAAFDAAGSVLALGAQPELPAFGMVGLARRQTAVLNLVLTQPPDPAHPGCRVTASFVDARGEVFHDRAGNEVKQTFVLRDNVAVALRLRAADILSPNELRRPIRAVVCYPVDTEPSDCNGMLPTREIVRPSGVTALSDYGQRTGGGGNPPPPPGELSLCATGR